MKKFFIIITVNCLATLLVHKAQSQTLSYPIVGTGVTQCYGNSTAISCPSNPTDAFYGQFQGSKCHVLRTHFTSSKGGHTF